MRFLFLLLPLFVLSCAGVENEKPREQMALKPVSYSALPGWEKEDFKDFSTAFLRSCEKIQKISGTEFLKGDPRWGKVEDWKALCASFEADGAQNPRHFFETHFTPYAITEGDEEYGLFTGYYESSLRGSRVRGAPYVYPLRARPDDLVMVNLGDFREELKGQRIAGRVKDGHLKPYESRQEIEEGKLPQQQDKPLLWIDDPVDAFFVQIQGSGAVLLDDGSVMRIGYDGQNGHIYTAIGKELIARGALEKENVSLQTIRAWLAANPANAQEVMNVNKSYVFFREIKGEGPVGGQGVALTPGRSLAIDHALLPYGMPLWLEAEYPLPGYGPIRHLMVAQDTGGAIRGTVRGDFFWGFGTFAEERAGRMKSRGRYWALLPKGAGGG